MQRAGLLLNSAATAKAVRPVLPAFVAARHVTDFEASLTTLYSQGGTCQPILRVDDLPSRIFVAPLLAAKAVARYLALLKPAQEALGDYNDVVVAEAACRAATPHSLGDAFVLGWLSARRDALAADAAARLKGLAGARQCWKD